MTRTSRTTKLEVVEPIGKRVLIRKDEDKKITKVGIHLPDKIEIPTITGRIVAISAEVAKDDNYPIEQYDRVLFNPKHGVPVDFEVYPGCYHAFVTARPKADVSRKAIDAVMASFRDAVANRFAPQDG